MCIAVPDAENNSILRPLFPFHAFARSVCTNAAGSRQSRQLQLPAIEYTQSRFFAKEWSSNKGNCYYCSLRTWHIGAERNNINAQQLDKFYDHVLKLQKGAALQ